jgi:TonB family protein
MIDARFYGGAMRGAVGVLVLVLGAAGALGQEAPMPTPGPDDQTRIDAAPGNGYEMEPGMTAPKIVAAVAAVYPEGVTVDGGNVRCLLSMVVGEDGLPRYVHVVHSAGDAFDLAAVHAVRQSKYEAGLREGRAVPVRMLVRVVFAADGAAAVPVMVQRTYGAGGSAVDYRPKVISGVDADYSEEARRKKISGMVIVSLVVDEEGLPTQVKVIQGIGYGLDEKAVDAVRQYRFRPAMKDGKPVACPLQIDVSFRLIH